MEGLKLAQATRSSQSKYFWGVIFAVLVGAIATFWIYLYLGYRMGFETNMHGGGLYSHGAFRHLEGLWTRAPESLHPNWQVNGAIVVGVLTGLFLYVMHINVLGWPFHPIGYAITNSYQINLVWFPLFVAWILKTNILKFGGLRLYRTALPFFLGMMLGEMVMGCAWSIIGIVFNVPYYNFWGA